MDQFLDLIEKEYGVEAREAATVYYLHDFKYNKDTKLENLVSNFGDVFMGYYEDEDDFAYQFLSDTFITQIPKEMWYYIDYNKWVNDFKLNGGWIKTIDGLRVAVFNG